MQLIISPAKTLDLDSPLPNIRSIKNLKTTTPNLIKESAKLIDVLKKLSPQKISKLMGVSGKIADLNYQRFKEWKYPYPSSSPSRPAIFMFKGDVYEGIDIHSFTSSQLKRLNEQLFILSGLYGVLRPLDNILPYRLEMGTKLKIGQAENLYQFWKDQVAKIIEKSLNSKSPLINLASNEYYQVLKGHLPKNLRIVQPIFKDLVKGEYKIVSFWAKKARGLMVKFIVQNNLKNVDELKNFNLERYSFNPKSSTDNDLVFIRKH